MLLKPPSYYVPRHAILFTCIHIENVLSIVQDSLRCAETFSILAHSMTAITTFLLFGYNSVLMVCLGTTFYVSLYVLWNLGNVAWPQLYFCCNYFKILRTFLAKSWYVYDEEHIFSSQSRKKIGTNRRPLKSSIRSCMQHFSYPHSIFRILIKEACP